MKSLSKYSVWITIGLPIALCLMVGCSPLQQKRRIPECRPVFDEIKKCWGKDPVSGLYHITAGATSEHGFGHLKNDKCFIGLAYEDMERLFGKPDTVLSGNMIYFMSQPCLGSEGQNANGCRFLFCAFGAEGLVRRINILMAGSAIDYLDTGNDKDTEKH